MQPLHTQLPTSSSCLHRTGKHSSKSEPAYASLSSETSTLNSSLCKWQVFLDCPSPECAQVRNGQPGIRENEKHAVAGPRSHPGPQHGLLGPSLMLPGCSRGKSCSQLLQALRLCAGAGEASGFCSANKGGVPWRPPGGRPPLKHTAWII